MITTTTAVVVHQFAACYWVPNGLANKIMESYLFFYHQQTVVGFVKEKKAHQQINQIRLWMLQVLSLTTFSPVLLSVLNLIQIEAFIFDFCLALQKFLMTILVRAPTGNSVRVSCSRGEVQNNICVHWTLPLLNVSPRTTPYIDQSSV